MTRPGNKVLLVDDDPSLLKVLAIRLRRAGHDVETASNGRKALSILRAFGPHVVVTDMQMDEMDGLKLFESIREYDSTLPVIMLTAHGTIPDAVDATRRGVFAYLTKPFDKNELLESIESAAKLYGDSHAEPGSDIEWCSEIITRSPAMTEMLREAYLVSRSDSSVLIRGESGTGKELLAQAMHRASKRAARDLVAVNCTAIPDQLFEAELFGHARGAFTGATAARDGLIVAADGGTLFLDEIGDMPEAVQAKLLRVLQEREVRPVGSTKTVRVDIRIISATHQNLEENLTSGTFREDLYYRLNVVTLEIPSLAERREDIPLLAEHLLGKAIADAGSSDVRAASFSRDAMEVLMASDWPGNIRHLKNVVEQCVVLATTKVIPKELVERALRREEKTLLPFAEARDRFEFEYLTTLLGMTEGNVAQAARLAGRNRSEFYKLLHKHELEPEFFRSRDGDDD